MRAARVRWVINGNDGRIKVVAALDQAWHIAKADAPNYWHKDLVYTYDTQEALFGQGKK